MGRSSRALPPGNLCCCVCRQGVAGGAHKRAVTEGATAPGDGGVEARMPLAMYRPPQVGPRGMYSAANRRFASVRPAQAAWVGDCYWHRKPGVACKPTPLAGSQCIPGDSTHNSGRTWARARRRRESGSGPEACTASYKPVCLLCETRRMPMLTLGGKYLTEAASPGQAAACANATSRKLPSMSAAFRESATYFSLLSSLWQHSELSSPSSGMLLSAFRRSSAS